MISKTFCVSLVGIDAFPVCVEVEAARGLPSESIVGLPDKAVRESKNRIRSAIRSAGFKFPVMSFTINLAPAYLPKMGSMFDLSIATAILKTTGQIKIDDNCILCGELSLDGYIRPINGILSIGSMMKKHDFKKLLVANKKTPDLFLLKDIELINITHLSQLKQFFSLKPCSFLKDFTFPKPVIPYDVSDIKGQYEAKRALEIAATGHHNLLLSGAPGSGKSMLLKRLPSILSPLSDDELVDCYKIYSLKKSTSSSFLDSRLRPFRSPHHNISLVGMIGGGKDASPGEISLAHGGVLFLDEFPEFSRQVIESLRQPLEDKKLLISRAQYAVTFPSSFILAAAMNPCPCGYYSDDVISCSCSMYDRQKYFKKISGPILDRIDLHVTVPRITDPKILHSSLPQNNFHSSTEILKRSIAANNFRMNRGQKYPNAFIPQKFLNHYCQLNSSAEKLLSKTISSGDLSGRGYISILKISRSIADLKQVININDEIIYEALFFRKKTLN